MTFQVSKHSTTLDVVFTRTHLEAQSQREERRRICQLPVLYSKTGLSAVVTTPVLTVLFYVKVFYKMPKGFKCSPFFLPHIQTHSLVAPLLSAPPAAQLSASDLILGFESPGGC